jgi:hypothetical protein
MKKLFAISLILFAVGCQKTEEIKPQSIQNTQVTVQPAQTKVESAKIKLPIDLAKFAKKSMSESDEIFGTPTEIKNDGNYRLYQISGEPKGLAVRFFDGKALNFNMLLSKPVATSKDAIKQVFGVDVGNTVPFKNPKEPLSEGFTGTFGGVKYKKLLAKKDDKGTGFIFVLAEIAEK